jgi:FkbM family methyltransferase
MNFIKRIIFKLLGVKTYLRVISRIFFLAYFNGWLKGRKVFDCHYMARKLINKGDYVIDLGANLGYYSLIFSRLVGENGKVFSIEPVELFREIFTKNTRKQKNIQLIPYAIGEVNNEIIKMGVPVTSSYFSHGRTHVLKSEENCAMTFEAEVMRPDTIFNNLEKLNYLKCDIEGYENIAIPLFKDILLKFKPVLQIEIDPENLSELMHFLKGLEYSAFQVKGEKLYAVTDPSKTYGDLIFIDKRKIGHYVALLAD